MNRIYFTADLHFGHPSVLKHSLKRPFVWKEDMAAHDAWLLDLWWKTIDNEDTVYILGDLTCYQEDRICQLLEKLPGRKYLIEGNHDCALIAYRKYFQGVCQVMEKRFRPEDYPFLAEDFQVVMCHYPMITWSRKHNGAVMLHGHCHGALDKYNSRAKELRFDVGLDSRLANLCFLTLEDVYYAAIEKIKRIKYKTIAEYARNNFRKEDRG